MFKHFVFSYKWVDRPLKFFGVGLTGEIPLSFMKVTAAM